MKIEPIEPLDEPAAAPAQRASVAGHIPNYGLLRFNWEGPKTGQKTVFLAGVSPSEGAAILADALEKLGVFVAPFPDGLQNDFRKTRGDFSAEHGTWVAHTPFDAKALKTAAKTAPGPHFILVMEDAVSLSAGIETIEDATPRGALAAAAKAGAEMALFAADTTDPVMVVSFQRAQEFPAMHADALTLFVGGSIDPASRAAAAETIRQGVRGLHAPDATETKYQGKLDPVQRRSNLRGWVKMPLNNERVRVRLLVDGEPAGETIADEARPDLVRRNVGDGHHGFTFPLKAHLSDTPKQVEVHILPEETLLGVAELSKTGIKILA